MIRNLFKHNHTDEPCSHMIGLLNEEAEGNAKGLSHWFTLQHVSGCKPCREFLADLRRNLGLLRQAKTSDTHPDALKRLEELVNRTVSSEEPPTT